MTVADLIEKLKEMPQDSEVVDDWGFPVDTITQRWSAANDEEVVCIT